MTALLIIGACFAHVTAAIVTSRYVLGAWYYADWKSGSRRLDFEDYRPHDPGMFMFGAVLFCLLAWPAMVLYVVGEGRGGFAIAPKHHRQAVALAKKDQRIAELERELAA